MPYGKGTYGSKRGRPPAKKGAKKGLPPAFKKRAEAMKAKKKGKK